MPWYADSTGKPHQLLDGELEDGTVTKTAVPADYIEVPPPEHGYDVWDFETGAYVPYVEPIDTAAVLEEKFFELIPKHDGKPYLTDDVVDDILSTKLKVKEAINIGRIDYAIKAFRAIRERLPVDMVPDLDTLLSMVK